MREAYLAGQGVLSAAIAWLSLRLGIMFWPLAILMILMIIDYITGMLASKAEAIQYPDDPNYGWSSKKGVLGVMKKVGYLGIIVVAVCLDHIIVTTGSYWGYDVPLKGLIGVIVTVWLVLNEMLSITENSGRMGAPVPPWLAKYIAVLKGKIEKEAEADE